VRDLAHQENPMNSIATSYPVGTPGQPWGPNERAQWLARQVRRRSYADDVLARIDALRPRFDVEEYGRLDYADESFSLHAIRSRAWREDGPNVLVTGGVHGYETSGVQGALQFVEHHADDYSGRVNLLVVPCVSPWAYERIHRWNADAIDPNRSFRADSPAGEAAALMRLVAPLRERFDVHIDLHETTDSDESEFRPALAARDGKTFEPGTVPDGFYLVGDAEDPQAEFQQAVLAAREDDRIRPDRGDIADHVLAGDDQFEALFLGRALLQRNGRFDVEAVGLRRRRHGLGGVDVRQRHEEAGRQDDACATHGFLRRLEGAGHAGEGRAP
jgi:hypothetical protein